MKTITRRYFLNQTRAAGLGVAAGGTLMAMARPSLAASAHEKINLAVIGVRGRGAALASGFAQRSDCEVTYLADVDTTLLESRAAAVAGIQGKTPKTVQDFRTVLDDKNVDAIAVATPDHWHALATVWGCQAGKHVYVEKPASHRPGKAARWLRPRASMTAWFSWVRNAAALRT